MNNKQRKRQRDIKNKLMAAICMLLVSSIMMVSSTYAWFTLSTAPEVTGINTAVGANGNLEMALLPESGQLTDIESNVGDSEKDLTVKNKTWGNLVSMSDATHDDPYGMKLITLYPAALDETAIAADDAGNPTTLGTGSFLATPSYGADGRVSSLDANTVNGTYKAASGTFPKDADDRPTYGVRAVGTANGMTDRQLAYRNARSLANTYMSQAKTQASVSLNTNGAALANIAIAHAVNANANHTQADVTALMEIVNDLLGEGSETGVLGYIEDAYVQNIIAFGASKSTADKGMDDTLFNGFKTAVTSAGSLDAVMNLFEAGQPYADYKTYLPAQITDPVAALKTTRGNVETAKTKLTALQSQGDSITWTQLSEALVLLADTNAMKINGFAASTFRDNMSAIVNSVAGGKGLVITIASGGGVYADVADHCGDFTASITIKKVEYNGMTLENMSARMETDSGEDTPYLEELATTVGRLSAPSSAGVADMPITDMFGYVIDLAFRTNAAESNLLLQQEGIDRIYTGTDEDNNTTNKGVEDTMGHGSTMTFTSTTTDFDITHMKSLMSAIRIVFFNPDQSNKVLATAKLDMAENKITVTGGNTVTAKMYLYKNTKAGDAIYTQQNYNQQSPAAEYYTHYQKVNADALEVGKQYYKLDNKQYVEVTYNDGVNDDLYTVIRDYVLCDHAAAAPDGTLYTRTESTGGEQVLTDNVITPLTQNTAQKVSVLVYLDGDKVTNEHVAATGSSSMTGTMNLQFASSAKLVPMEYTNLMQQGETTPATPEGGGAGA